MVILIPPPTISQGEWLDHLERIGVVVPFGTRYRDLPPQAYTNAIMSYEWENYRNQREPPRATRLYGSPEELQPLRSRPPLGFSDWQRQRHNQIRSLDTAHMADRGRARVFETSEMDYVAEESRTRRQNENQRWAEIIQRLLMNPPSEEEARRFRNNLSSNPVRHQTDGVNPNLQSAHDAGGLHQRRDQRREEVWGVRERRRMIQRRLERTNRRS